MSNERTIRWGLLGAGAILDRWMKGAVQVENMEIAAVASRSQETAQRMAKRHHIPEALTYDEMLARKDIEVVYVPVPHPAHKDLALRAMKAGKHVLVEKPATVCAADFAELTECAAANQVFLMEAVWTRFFPLSQELVRVIRSGEIGDVRLIQSAFSFRSEPDLVPRLFDPMQAGGGLLDTGVYNLHFTDMILDKVPEALTGLASFDTDGLHLQVDEQASYIARYDNGELAVLTSGVRTDIPDTAYIYGTEGSIEIPVFWKPSEMIIRGKNKERTVSMPVEQKKSGVEDEGYQYEIRHVNDCIRDGLIQSPVMTWKKTFRVLEQCDQLRRSWNFRYPFEG